MNAVKHKLTLGSCIGKMKAELGSVCELQRAAKAAATTLAGGREGAQEEDAQDQDGTDYSLLMQGQSPITNIQLDFGFDGDDGDGGDGGEGFKLEHGKISRAQAAYTLFFDLTSPKNIINIFQTLALGLLGVIKNGGVMLTQMVNVRSASRRSRSSRTTRTLA